MAFEIETCVQQNRCSWKKPFSLALVTVRRLAGFTFNDFSSATETESYQAIFAATELADGSASPWSAVVGLLLGAGRGLLGLRRLQLVEVFLGCLGFLLGLRRL